MSTNFKLMFAALLFIMQILPIAALSQETAHASITIFRTADENEDDIYMLFDSSIVARIKPESQTEVEIPHGKHWIIFSYGPNSFMDHRPQYKGELVDILPGDNFYFNISYRSWGDQFFKINIDRLNEADARLISESASLKIARFSQIAPIDKLKPRKFRKITEKIQEENSDSSVFRYTSGKIRIKIPVEKNSITEIKNVKKNEDSFTKTDTIEPVVCLNSDNQINHIKPVSMRSEKEIKRDIIGSKAFLKMGIPVLCTGATLSAVSYTILTMNSNSETADNSTSGPICTISGILIAGSGITLIKIGKNRMKRFQGELDRHALSVNIGFNAISVSCSF